MFSIDFYLISVLAIFAGGVLVRSGYTALRKQSGVADLVFAVGVVMAVVFALMVMIDRTGYGGTPVAFSERDDDTIEVITAVPKDANNIILFVRDGFVNADGGLSSKERLFVVPTKLFTEAALKSLPFAGSDGVALQLKRLEGPENTPTKIIGLPEEANIDFKYKLTPSKN